jgi:hypothetical protein
MLRKLKPIFSPLLLALLFFINACKKESPDKQTITETVTPFATAIGNPVGSPVSKEIGAAGGSVTSPDGKITLTVPAGALSSNTSITIQPVENTAPNGVGASYDFLPNGQQFAKPITVTFHYSDDDLAGTSPELLEFGFQNAQNAWQGKGNLQVNKTYKTVSASISHFSRWSFYATYAMTPNQKTMLVNETALLQVWKLPYSEDPEPGHPEEMLHTLGQTQLVASDKVSNWLVNGVVTSAGGTNGWLTGEGANEKHYHAPANVPASNPITVSADINTGKGKITLVSNMIIQKEVAFEFSCGGQRYQNLDGTVAASTSAGTLYVFMMSKEVSGDKIPSLVLAIGESFYGKGSYAFGEKNQVACTVTSDPYEWKTEYFEENSSKPKYGTGTVTIEKWGGIGELVTGTISGTLHYQKTILNYVDHRTAALNATFSFYRTE